MAPPSDKLLEDTMKDHDHTHESKMTVNHLQTSDKVNSQLQGGRLETSAAMGVLAKTVLVYYTESPDKKEALKEVTPELATQVLALASGPYRSSLRALRFESVRETAVGIRKNMDAIRASLQRHVNLTSSYGDKHLLETAVDSVKHEKTAAVRFSKKQLEFIEDIIIKTRLPDHTPDGRNKAVNILSHEELNGAEFDFLQASWSKELMDNKKDPVTVKAATSLAHVQGMHVMYRGLLIQTGIENAIPELAVVKKALSSLGSSACLAVHGLLEDCQSTVASDARAQLMGPICCNTKLKPASGHGEPNPFGAEAPTKAPVTLKNVVDIPSTVGKGVAGSEPVPTPWDGPAQQRKATRFTRSPSRSNKMGKEWKPPLKRYD